MPPEHDLTESERPRLRRRADGTEYLLGDETLVGRGLECDILISDSDSISRRHARLFHDSDGLSVSDLGSTNGTHLNGREVTGRTALSDGDVLAFDEYEFDVVIPVVTPAAQEDAQEDPAATRIVRSEPEQTRVVSRADVIAHLDEAPSSSEGQAPAAAAEAQSPAPEKAGDQEAWPSPSIADEMGDGDWRWPENDGDGPSDRAADDGEAVSESAGSTERADVAGAEAPATGDDPREPAAPEPAMAEAAPAADPTPTPPPSAETPPAAAPEPAPAERAPAAAVEASAPRAERPADPPRRDERPPARAGEEKPEAAPLPGAWANAAEVQGGAGHTMIVKYAAPQAKAPPPVDRESLHGPTLVVGTDDPNGQLLSLDGPDTEWVIGSNPDSDLHIDHESVSARHAVLSREGGKWRLSDELSANGTYANGSRINVGFVGDGHALRFGTVECILMIPKGGRGRAAAGRAPAKRAAGPAAPRDGSGSSVPWKMIAIAVVAVVLVAAIGAGAAFYLMSQP